MPKLLIAPSILAADFSILGDRVDAAVKGGADWIHLDVMDGHFVPNISFGTPIVRSVRRRTTLPLDVHLMITEPDRYVRDFREAGADIITVHQEACPDLAGTLMGIRDLGAKAGVSIKPATPVETVREALQLADLVLVMSVNPGFGGQSFMPSSAERIRALRKMIEASGRPIHLEVDGGIDPQTGKVVVEAGADVLVAGTSVFGQPDVAGAIRLLKQCALPERR